MTRLSLPCVALALLAGGLAADVRGDTVETSTPTPPPSERGPNMTFQRWDRFASAQAPNEPDAGLFNPNGMPHLTNQEPTAFITSTGNIYSHQAPVRLVGEIPNYGDASATWTSVFVNVSALGQLFDGGGVTVSGHAPVWMLVADEDPTGLPYGGYTRNWSLRYEVPGNATSYLLGVPANLPSISVDRVSVTTVFTTGAEPVRELPADFPGSPQFANSSGPGNLPVLPDLTGDGTVNRSDLAKLAAHFGTRGHASWADGDLNVDGKVALDDLVLLRNGMTLGGVGIAPAAAIPEPGGLLTAALCGVGLTAWGARRRRARDGA